MTEQMTGRTGAGGPDGPAGSPDQPPPPAAAMPSPRDLAARSPHRDAARAAERSHPEAPESPGGPDQNGTAQHGTAQAGQDQHGTAQNGTAQNAQAEPRAHAGGSPARVRATGAQALVYALERVGADVVFGIPGGAVLPAYDPLLDSKLIRHILVRHEQGAGHAATGYAQATGRVGVCMATSGPGATNLVTPIADAYMDSVPLVAITGQVATSHDRHRRLPGGRHLRDHHPDHQAQLPGHQARGHRPDHRRGVPRGLDRAARPGPGRHRQGRHAGHDRFQLAGALRPARLPPGDQAARPAGARGCPADQRVPAPGAVRRRRRDQGGRLGPAA